MNFNFKDIATATMILFAVIDIIGGIPIVIGLREKQDASTLEEPLLLLWLL